MEVTLTYYGEDGEVRTVRFGARRFTIGRSPDNDLEIPDSKLSRRHAVIESFDGAIQVSDCGSQNGTAVNGEPLVGAAPLRDGDVVTLGRTCDLTVRIRPAAVEPSPGPVAARHSRASSALPPPARPLTPDTHAAPSGVSQWLSTPVLAAAAAGLILLTAMLFVVISKSDGGATTRADRDRRVDVSEEAGGEAGEVRDRTSADNTPRAESKRTPDAPTEGEGGGAEGASAEQVEKAAIQVMRRISSDDKTYGFGDKALSDIGRRVEEYAASPAVREALQALQRGGGAVAVQARREGLEPDLAIYAGLAVADGGRSGRDPVAAAREMIPALLSLRATFGSGDADSSLLIVAAYSGGGVGSKKSHPLLATMRRLVHNPLTQRNVWFLHERGGLAPQDYDFVVRFLALGVIAQNPRQFGVAADPLTF
jgi:hypothetical protein